MYKRAILMMVLAAALLLSACGSAAEAPAEEVQGPVAELAAEESPFDGEQLELAFWYPYGEGSWTGDFLAARISEYNETHAGVVISGQSFESYTAIIEALQRGAAAENLPAVATIGYGFDEYIVESGLATAFNESLGDETEAYLKDFFPALIEVTTFDGVTYGIPLALSVAEIFYHSDLFEQAGLDPEAPPTTWAELMDAAATIKTNLDIYGVTFALDDPWIFETTVRSNGGVFLNAAGEPELDSAIARAALGDWGTGVAEGTVLYNADFFETLQTFGAQQVAMFATSSYGTLIYNDIAPLVMAMPWPAAEGEVARIPAGGNSLYIFGNNKAEKAAAAEFVLFLTSTEANAEWAMNSGYLPTRVSSLESMVDFIDEFENYQIAVFGINSVVTPTQFGTDTLQANEYIMQAIEKVMLGAEGVDDALAEANLKISGMLAQ